MNIPTKEELSVINQAIKTRYGLDFNHYEHTAFSRRVAKILYKYKLESVYDLWKKILYDNGFIKTFINEITVGLTELFRNPALWQRIGEEVLPVFATQAQVRIWHAGCSTGEEIYTMLITLSEHALLHKSKVVASDINSNWLEKARRGAYQSSLLEKYNKNYKTFTKTNFSLKQYARVGERQFFFNSSLKIHTTFLLHNLTHDTEIDTFDLIFCRNVLIYFDDTFKSKVLNLFHKSLNPHGLLVLGYYDIFPKNQTHLFTSFSNKFKIFRKASP